MFDPAVVPNPYVPLAPDAAAGPGGRSFAQQRRRRAEILATTRRLLAEGQEAFTLRRVADENRVTVQTVRNSFGRREDLMVSAINEHTSAVWRALGGFSSGPALFLDLAQMYFQCARATPEFLRAMVTQAVANTPSLSVLQQHGSAIKVAHLRRLAREGGLRPGVDAEALAAQITRLNTFQMYEWAAGGDALALRHELVVGNKLLLLGAVTPNAAARVEAWTPAEAA
jgi:AcrR family transcriptional regulator